MFHEKFNVPMATNYLILKKLWAIQDRLSMSWKMFVLDLTVNTLLCVWLLPKCNFIQTISHYDQFKIT